MFPTSRSPSPSPSVSSIASTSSIASDTASTAPQGTIAVAPQLAGNKALRISKAWLSHQKKSLDAYQKGMLDFALDAM